MNRKKNVFGSDNIEKTSVLSTPRIKHKLPKISLKLPDLPLNNPKEEQITLQ